MASMRDAAQGDCKLRSAIEMAQQFLGREQIG